MRKIILILMLFLINGFTELETTISSNFKLVELADGVYGCINKFGGKAICNAGIIDLGNETLIFDTFLSPEAANEIPRLVKELNLSPIKFVVNSHWHNDHIRGNQIFPKEIDLISTKKTADLIRINEPKEIADEKNYAPKQLARFDSLLVNFNGDSLSRDYKKIKMWQAYFKVLTESNKILETRVPTVYVENRKLINGKKRDVELLCFGRGHTESDLVLFLPKEKILFSGDLVFIGMHPYLADGFIDDWKNYLVELEKLDIEKVVPGHGEVGNSNDISIMKKYIEMVEEKAEKMIKEGLSVKNVDSISVPKIFSDWWFDNFFRTNLKFVYGKKIK